MAEARVLAHNFKDKDWLEMALKVSERIYGKGSGIRIKAYMRVIWRDELLRGIPISDLPVVRKAWSKPVIGKPTSAIPHARDF